METTFRAELIATLITANCEAYHARRLSYGAWSAKQNRLWALAAKHGVASDVVRLVAPSLSRVVPPYAVRKQLRDATLAVGR